MKYFFISFLFLFNSPFLKAQNNIFGKYQNEFGETLILKSDKTFEYTWNFDLASSWNDGTWKIVGKNVFLDVAEVRDSVLLNGKVEMVLSSDRISNKITNEEYALSLISAGGQSRNPLNLKYLLSRGKLYTFSKDGKLRNEKIKSFSNSNKFFKPWFEKKLLD